MSLAAAGLVVLGLGSRVFDAALVCALLARVCLNFVQDFANQQKSLFLITSTVFYFYEGIKFILSILWRLICMDPSLLLRPRHVVRALSFSFQTGKTVAQIHLRCFRWSAGSLKTLIVKACSTATFGHSWTQYSTEKEEDATPAWMKEDLEHHRQVLTQYNTRLSFFREMPWKQISHLWGQLHNAELPHYLRRPVIGFFSWLFGCNPSEAINPDFTAYRNLAEYFRRKIRPELRPVETAHDITSPADGRVLYLSKVEDGVLEQVKGVTYSLQGFLGPPEGLYTNKSTREGESSKFHVTDAELEKALLRNPENSLYQCIIYLAPGDYHCFHSPTQWQAFTRRHFPGELFSVHPGVARWCQGLFNMNERAVYTGQWQHGFFSMTAVGATNVGSVNVFCDPELMTNTELEYEAGTFYDRDLSGSKHRGVTMKNNQLMGEFNLGSTIVLLFEAPKTFEFSMKPGQKVSVGQGVGRCNTRRRRQGDRRKRNR